MLKDGGWTELSQGIHSGGLCINAVGPSGYVAVVSVFCVCIASKLLEVTDFSEEPSASFSRLISSNETAGSLEKCFFSSWHDYSELRTALKTYDVPFG